MCVLYVLTCLRVSVVYIVHLLDKNMRISKAKKGVNVPLRSILERLQKVKCINLISMCEPNTSKTCPSCLKQCLRPHSETSSSCKCTRRNRYKKCAGCGGIFQRDLMACRNQAISFMHLMLHQNYKDEFNLNVTYHVQ